MDVLLVAAILARWSRQPFLPLLRSAAFTTAATFAIMASVSLALVVLWTQSPALALVLAGPLVAVALHQRATHNALRAMRLALTDPLTGLGNHRHFQEQLQIQLEEAAAAGAPLTVCLFDLDDFKQINDRYGHPVGDRVLAHVASKLRQLGEAFRLGGDEFAVVFPRERADAAAAAAEEVVRALGDGGLGAGRPAQRDGRDRHVPRPQRRPQRARARRRHRALLGEGRGQEPGVHLPARHACGDPAAAAHACARQGGAAPGGRGARDALSTLATRSKEAIRPESAIWRPASARGSNCPRRRSS